MSQTLPSQILGRTIDALFLGPWHQVHLGDRSLDWECSDLLVTLSGGVQLALMPTLCEFLPCQSRASASSPVPDDVLVCIGTTLIDVIRRSEGYPEVFLVLSGHRLLENSSLPEGTRPNTFDSAELTSSEAEEAYTSLVSGRSGTLSWFLSGHFSGD